MVKREGNERVTPVGVFLWIRDYFEGQSQIEAHRPGLDEPHLILGLNDDVARRIAEFRQGPQTPDQIDQVFTAIATVDDRG